MRRLFPFVLAAAFAVLPAFSLPAFSQDQKFTIDGEVAILSVSVKADKTADYEKVLAKLKEVLMAGSAETKQQAAGWQVIRSDKPQPDGTIIYMHIIRPVKGADYRVLANIYLAVKDNAEQRALYDVYIATGAKNLSLGYGTVAMDFGK